MQQRQIFLTNPKNVTPWQTYWYSKGDAAYNAKYDRKACWTKPISKEQAGKANIWNEESNEPWLQMKRGKGCKGKKTSKPVTEQEPSNASDDGAGGSSEDAIDFSQEIGKINWQKYSVGIVSYISLSFRVSGIVARYRSSFIIWLNV